MDALRGEDVLDGLVPVDLLRGRGGGRSREDEGAEDEPPKHGSAAEGGEEVNQTSEREAKLSKRHFVRGGMMLE